MASLPMTGVQRGGDPTQPVRSQRLCRPLMPMELRGQAAHPGQRGHLLLLLQPRKGHPFRSRADNCPLCSSSASSQRTSRRCNSSLGKDPGGFCGLALCRAGPQREPCRPGLQSPHLQRVCGDSALSCHHHRCSHDTPAHNRTLTHKTGEPSPGSHTTISTLLLSGQGSRCPCGQRRLRNGSISSSGGVPALAGAVPPPQQ